MSETVKIITAPGMFGASASDNLLDTCMRMVGVAFGDPDEWPSKYGATVENDVFMMHRYCWCEKETCLWCAGCACGSGNLRHTVDGRDVTSEEAWQFNKQLLGKLPHELYEYGTPEYKKYSAEWDGRVKERDRRKKEFYPAIRHVCGHSFMADRTSESEDSKPRQNAPNFFFKPTGFRLWWYKYIGRDMEIYGGDLPHDFMDQVFATHPKGMSVEQAFNEWAKREEETEASFRAMLDSLGVVRSA